MSCIYIKLKDIYTVVLYFDSLRIFYMILYESLLNKKFKSIYVISIKQIPYIQVKTINLKILKIN